VIEITKVSGAENQETAARRSWYAQASGTEQRVFWCCYAGWALDALDVQMFSLAIPAILATWAISKTAAGSVTSASLVASAIGGWLFGSLTDRYGGVRMLQLAVFCFSFFTFLTAFAQNFPQQLVLKTLQGFGFGGEWAVGVVLMSAAVKASYRGKAMGTLQSGWAVGWGLAVLLYSAVFSLVPAASAWRVLFMLGLLPALLILVVQRKLPRNLHPPVRDRRRTRFLDIFRASSLRVTLIGGLLGVGAHGGYYALTTWLPTYFKQERHLSVLGTGGYLAVIIAAFFLGCLACGQMLDRLGRRRTILLFAVCCVVTAAVALLVPISNQQMLWLGLPLGFFTAGIPASMGPLFSELYPTGIRGSGVGFCYNAGRILSAGFPALVGHLSSQMKLGTAIGIDAVFAYSLVVVAVLLLPETAGKALPAQRA
jgi:MFS family permease